MGQKAFTEPSPSDWERWEARLGQGEEPSLAARQAAPHLTCSAFRRQDPARHAAAIAMSREARGHIVDRMIEDKVAEYDTDGHLQYRKDASDTMVVTHAKRWNAAYAGTQKVELTGADGGPLALEVADAREQLARRVAGIAARTGEDTAPS